MNSGKVLLGVVAGAAAGAIMGILLAPAKGSVTTKKIARKGRAYAEDAKETLNTYIDALIDELGALKEGTLDLVEKGTDKAVSMARAKHAKRD